jgi:predicted nucleic acid-binding protein
MICLDTNIVIWIINGRSSALHYRLGEQLRVDPRRRAACP